MTVKEFAFLAFANVQKTVDFGAVSQYRKTIPAAQFIARFVKYRSMLRLDDVAVEVAIRIRSHII